MDPRDVTLLWNERTNRPRLPWRLLGWLVTLFVLSLVVTTAADFVLRRPIESVLVLLTPAVRPGRRRSRPGTSSS